MTGESNLRVLQPSRKRPQVGDIFTLSPALKTYLLGRVVSTTARWAERGGDTLLLYIYDIVREIPVPPDDEELTPKNLFVEPLMTNRLGWSRGYFMTVAHRELREQDRLPVHCFRNSKGEYYDEEGRRLQAGIEPVGERGLHSYRTIDDLVSERLGIPLAPD